MAVNVVPCNLVFAVALVEHAGLNGVIVQNPRQIVVHIDCSVPLIPGRCAKIIALKVNVTQAAEADVRNSGRRIQQRQRNVVVCE